MMIEISRPATKEDIQDLLSWLETKPVLESYNMNNCYNCLIAQYLKARGVQVRSVTADSFFTDYERFKIPKVIKRIAYGKNEVDFLGVMDGYFGDAANRARTELENLD